MFSHSICMCVTCTPYITLLMLPMRSLERIYRLPNVSPHLQGSHLNPSEVRKNYAMVFNSQFLLIQSQKLLTTNKPKSRCRTFKMVVANLVAKRDMEGLYLSLC